MRTTTVVLLAVLSLVVVGNATLAQTGIAKKQMAASRPASEGRRGARKPIFYPRVPRLEKGEFIFFPPYVVTETEKHLRYYERLKSFRVCLTNGYWNFAPKFRDELHAEGCELFIYIWFNGFYAKEMLAADKKTEVLYMSGIWREIFKHPDWLLNADNPMKGGGADYPAYFFDYTNPELRKFLVSFIKKRLDEVGYDGVFFDYIGSSPLPKEINELWKNRYANTTYNEAGAVFVRELREALGKKRIFANQAYRAGGAYYPYIDYDLTESHGTSFIWGKEVTISLNGKAPEKALETYRRTWDGEAGYSVINADVHAAKKHNPDVQMFQLNYLTPRYVPTGKTIEKDGKTYPVFTDRTDRSSIFYGYCLAKIHNDTSYSSDWYASGFGQDDVYFLDLGDPLEETYRELDDVVVRYYENGFVLVTRVAGSIDFPPDGAMIPEGVTGLWDIYEGSRVWGWAENKPIAVNPTYYPASESYYLASRVFMYERVRRGSR